MSTLLPPNSTPQERALEASAERMATLPVHIDRTWDPARCPAELLPWLAWALSVDEWKAEWPEETKRDAIAASAEVHRKKGTAGALKRALRALRVHARVVEWWEEDADPYTFRLEIDAAPTGYNEDDDDELERVVSQTKNLRSHYKGAKISAQAMGSTYIGATTRLVVHTRITP